MRGLNNKHPSETDACNLTTLPEAGNQLQAEMTGSARLPESLAAWGTPMFEETLKREVGLLTGEILPLQAALTRGSYASDRVDSVILLSNSESEDSVNIKAGLQYAGIIAGCGCADYPTPDNETVEYCVVLIEISKDSAAVLISLLPDA